MESIRSVIAKQPFWKGLSESYLDMLAQNARAIHFDARETIFSQGSYADRAYLVLHGSVAIETSFLANRGRLTIQTLGPGQALGWSWYFYPFEWHYSVIALEASELLAFDAHVLREKAKSDARFGFELISRVSRVMVSRLEEVRGQLQEACAARY